MNTSLYFTPSLPFGCPALDRTSEIGRCAEGTEKNFMTINHIFILLSIFLTLSCNQRNFQIRKNLSDTNWEGKIVYISQNGRVHEYDIRVRFKNSEGKINADYSYNNFSSSIPLQIEIKDDNLILTEFPESENDRASFHGKYSPDMISGKWTKSNGISYPFYLVRDNYIKSLSDFESNAFTGRYSLSGQNDVRSGLIQIRPNTNSSFFFYLDINRGPPSYNMGSSFGEATLINPTTAIFKISDTNYKCELHFSIEKNILSIEEMDYSEAYCGWGHAVSSAGKYRRINSNTPFYALFDNGIILFDSKNSFLQ
jgi:hypothetical protein